jgi:hypothetical protein
MFSNEHFCSDAKISAMRECYQNHLEARRKFQHVSSGIVPSNAHCPQQQSIIGQAKDDPAR